MLPLLSSFRINLLSVYILPLILYADTYWENGSKRGWKCFVVLCSASSSGLTDSVVGMFITRGYTATQNPHPYYQVQVKQDVLPSQDEAELQSRESGRDLVRLRGRGPCGPCPPSCSTAVELQPWGGGGGGGGCCFNPIQCSGKQAASSPAGPRALSSTFRPLGGWEHRRWQKEGENSHSHPALPSGWAHTEQSCLC